MKKLLTISLLSLIGSLQAAITPQLIQAAPSPVALGVIPFDDQQSQAIEQDLQLSGRFRLVIAPKIKSVDDATEVNVQAWKKKGLRYLLFGNGSQLSVIDLMAKANAPDVLDTSMSNPNQAANAIYQKLIGSPGYFSDKLAYVLLEKQSGLASQYSLMTAGINGQNEKTVVTSNLPIMTPVWSHDGKQIAYVSFAKGNAAIYLADLDQGTQTLLVKSKGFDAAPSFSPDDKSLVFMSTRNGQSNLYQMNLATKQVSQLTSGWSVDASPVYSTDGSSLYFTSNRDGSPQIYQLDLSTKKITRVTFNGDYNAIPSVSNQWLVFLHRRWGLFGIAKKPLIGGKIQMLDRGIGDNDPRLLPQGDMVVFSQRYANRQVLAMVSIDGQVKLRLPAENGDVMMPAVSS